MYNSNRHIITLRYATKCADCGADLPVGTRARYYRGRYGGKAYGLDCHEQKPVNTATHRTLDAFDVQQRAEQAMEYLMDCAYSGEKPY